MRADDRGGGCLACATMNGTVAVPGGVVWEDEAWVVDHCLGPFAVGAMVLKTKAHRESLPELTDAEARGLGTAVRFVSAAMVAGLPCERVYVSAWVDRAPLHVHFVFEPRYREEREIGAWELQARRRASGPPDPEQAAVAARRVRRALAERVPGSPPTADREWPR